MFYWLYEQLSAGGHIPVFNLFKYITFRTGMSLFTAQSWWWRWVRASSAGSRPSRAAASRSAPKASSATSSKGRHADHGRGDDPGRLFAGTLLWADLSNVYVWAVLLVTGATACWAFPTTTPRSPNRRRTASPSKVRLALEAAIAMAACALIVLFAAKPPEAPDLLTSVSFPIFKQALINLNWFYLLFGPSSSWAPPMR